MADSVEVSASTFGANRLGRLLHVRALLLVMWSPLIGTAAAHSATGRHHASITTDHANDEQHDTHNRENILQIHIRLQDAEIREKGHHTYCQLETFARAPLIAGIYLFTKLALFLCRRYGIHLDRISIDASRDCCAPSAKFVEVASVPI
jgi:hypothetical protein